jgi:hypothetical protein
MCAPCSSQPLRPAIVVEAAVDCVARWVVIELDPEDIELRLADHLVHLKVERVQRALRRTRDEILARGRRVV